MASICGFFLFGINDAMCEHWTTKGKHSLRPFAEYRQWVPFSVSYFECKLLFKSFHSLSTWWKRNARLWRDSVLFIFNLVEQEEYQNQTQSAELGHFCYIQIEMRSMIFPTALRLKNKLTSPPVFEKMSVLHFALNFFFH